MADREWSYVAASRSRFSTTVYANCGALAPIDIDSHQPKKGKPAGEDRALLVEKLAFGMSRSRAKGTALDWAATAENAPVSGFSHTAQAGSGAARVPSALPAETAQDAATEPERDR